MMETVGHADLAQRVGQLVSEDRIGIIGRLIDPVTVGRGGSLVHKLRAGIPGKSRVCCRPFLTGKLDRPRLIRLACLDAVKDTQVHVQLINRAVGIGRGVPGSRGVHQSLQEEGAVIRQFSLHILDVGIDGLQRIGRSGIEGHIVRRIVFTLPTGTHRIPAFDGSS